MKRITLILTLITTMLFNTLMAQLISPAPYCDAKYDDEVFPIENAIRKVSFGTLTNNSNAQYPFPHYVFYNNLSAPTVTKGSLYNLSLEFETHGLCGYGVWIDYNRNNIFETTEKVAGTTGMQEAGPTNFNVVPVVYPTRRVNVTIPTSALTGLTRMRVRLFEDDNYIFGPSGTSILPCNLSATPRDIMDWGETEDYNINIVGSLGLNDVQEVDSFIIYPNPVVTTINVKQELYNSVGYKIINGAGQEVQAGTLTNSEKQINVASLSEGIYYLQLFESNRAIGQQKFVKAAK